MMQEVWQRERVSQGALQTQELDQLQKVDPSVKGLHCCRIFSRSCVSQTNPICFRIWGGGNKADRKGAFGELMGVWRHSRCVLPCSPLEYWYGRVGWSALSLSPEMRSLPNLLSCCYNFTEFPLSWRSWRKSPRRRTYPSSVMQLISLSCKATHKEWSRYSLRN
jgi:hypothetical protein